MHFPQHTGAHTKTLKAHPFCQRKILIWERKIQFSYFRHMAESVIALAIIWYCHLDLYWQQNVRLFSYESWGPTLQLQYRQSIEQHYYPCLCALTPAISFGAVFCPSNVYRENVSLSSPGILRGHNGISAARWGYSTIHANHVCFFPSHYTTKGLISSIKKVLNSSTTHYGRTDTAAGSGSHVNDAWCIAHKDGVPP